MSRRLKIKMKVIKQKIVRSLSKKKILALSFSAACFVSMRFAWYVLGLELEECSGIWLWIKDSNFHFYLVMLLLFLAVLLGIRAVFIPFGPVEDRENEFIMPLYEQAMIIALPVMMVLYSLHCWFWVESLKEFPYSASTKPAYAVPAGFMVLLFIAGITAVFYMVVKGRDISAFSLYLLYALCMVLCFYGTYYVNIFRTDLHHGIAVTETIYNVCDLIPYSKITTGIYGHYGLFFLLPVRLSHGSPYVISALIAVSGCITVASSLYVCHVFLPKNWIRAAAACAAVYEAAVHKGSGHYWQVFPIREMFPALLCAYVCCLLRKKRLLWNTKWMWAGYALVSLAILWNTESGLFCLSAYSAYIITEQLQLHQWYDKQQISLYIKLFLYGICSILMSVGIVNLYNLFCKGKLIFRAFFIPLLTKGYMDGTIRYDLPWGNHAWVYVFILFGAVCAWGFYHTSLFKGMENAMCKDAPAAVLIAVLGLLLFSYYLNRAAYSNLTICYCEAVYANALIIGKTWTSFHHWSREVSMAGLCKKAAGVLSMIIVTSLGVQIVLSPINMEKASHSPEVLTTKELMSDLAVMTERLPENVYGAGAGISILYHLLGWDHYAHVRDFSDLLLGGNEVGEDTMNVLVEEILQQDSFLLSGFAHSKMILERVSEKDPSYELADTFTIQNINFYYYKK